MATTATPARRANWRAERTRTPWTAAGLAVGGCALVGLTHPGNPLLPPCPFKVLTGLDCPGCGLTRGMRELLTGHPLAALDHNVLLVAVVPLAAWMWLAWAGLAGRHTPPRLGARGNWALGALLLVFAVVRNLPLPLCRWLASGGPGG